MAVAEMVNKKVLQPFPRERRSWLRDILKIDSVIFGLAVENFAIFVLAQAERKTDFV